MPDNSSSTALNPQNLSFENTEIAFKSKSDKDLKNAYRLFSVLNRPFLSKIGPPLINLAMRLGLPVTPLIRNTIFRHFCGGETISECERTIEQLVSGGVGAILDYSVEGGNGEAAYTETAAEIVRTIKRAKNDQRIPFTVFKVSGIARFSLLAKMDAGKELNNAEHTEFFKVKGRVNNICKTAFDAGVPVMIDAEESWIQNTIDQLALDMMRLYNRDKAIVYNTYQLYRMDKLESLKADISKAERGNFVLGAKLVRGAYLEKEQKRAEKFNYSSSVYSAKTQTDRDYNEALWLCAEHLEKTAFIAATHNEESCLLLTKIMAEKNIEPHHPHIYFSQLLGMGDHISFNLAAAGYNTAKYVPYGPVKAVLPYLLRRVDENKSMLGHAVRELALIRKEKKRRRKLQLS